MKENKFMAIVLSAGLVLASTGQAFAADSTNKATDGGSSTAITQPTPSDDTVTPAENESPNPDSTAKPTNEDFTNFETEPHNIDENVERIDDADDAGEGTSNEASNEAGEDFTDFETQPHNIDDNVERLDDNDGASKDDDGKAQDTEEDKSIAAAETTEDEATKGEATKLPGDPAVAKAPAPVNKSSKSTKEAGSNPKTSVTGMATLTASLTLAATALAVNKKEK